MTRLLAFAALLISTSCVTASYTDSGARVRVTQDPEVVKGCEYLGDVKGSDKMNGGALGQGAAEETAHRRLKNHAAAMGANVVLLKEQGQSFSGCVVS